MAPPNPMTKPDEMDIDADVVDDDPITASYNVFLNPALPHGRRLIVLQQPNRTDGTARAAPTELRLKSHSGMVEVDLPLDNTAAYDREKGLRWGRVLQASMAAKNGGSHGLAGGFGFGAVQQQQRGRKKGEGEGDDNDDYMDWNEAVRQDKVLRTQTLGGQYPDTDEVQCMVGVFHGRSLHLTPISSVVHLRPQLHHLDAAAQHARAAASAASSSSSKDQPAGSTASAARAIHMTIKNATDGDGVTTETMADRLRYVQSENWRKMPYTDENDESAWDVYNESLFLQPSSSAAEPDLKDDPSPPALEHLVPTLAARWADRQMLEAVSGIVKSDPEPGLEEKIPIKSDRQPGLVPDRPARQAAPPTRRGPRA